MLILLYKMLKIWVEEPQPKPQIIYDILCYFNIKELSLRTLTEKTIKKYLYVI